jgi:hypothetical protein
MSHIVTKLPARPATILLLQLSLAVAAGCQPLVRPLRSGDTIRVWSRGPVLKGTTGLLEGQSGDTVRLARTSRITGVVRTTAIPARGLYRVDVQRGARRSVPAGVLGAVIGAPIGWKLGLSIAGVPRGSCSDLAAASVGDVAGCTRAGFRNILVSVLGGAIGASIGGSIGGRLRPRWETVFTNLP